MCLLDTLEILCHACFLLIKKVSIYYYEIVLFHLPPPHLSLSPMRKKTCKASAMDAPAQFTFPYFFSFFPFLFLV
jgi:hypothetical protein